MAPQFDMTRDWRRLLLNGRRLLLLLALTVTHHLDPLPLLGVILFRSGLGLIRFFWTEQEAWYSLPPCWDIVGVSVYKAEDVAHHGVDCHEHGVTAGAQELLEEEILHCGRENLEQAAFRNFKVSIADLLTLIISERHDLESILLVCSLS